VTITSYIICSSSGSTYLDWKRSDRAKFYRSWQKCTTYLKKKRRVLKQREEIVFCASESFSHSWKNFSSSFLPSWFTTAAPRHRLHVTPQCSFSLRARDVWRKVDNERKSCTIWLIRCRSIQRSNANPCGGFLPAVSGRPFYLTERRHATFLRHAMHVTL